LELVYSRPLSPAHAEGPAETLNSAKERGSHGALRSQLPVTRKVAAATEGGSTLPLLNHFLQLRAQHVHLTPRLTRQTGGTICVNKIATQRDVKPVALLAFDGEFVGLIDVRGIRRIASRLYAADQLSTVPKRLSASRTYSLTTSICLSITRPVKRSIATCTQ
jgi:hypothetical protein